MKTLLTALVALTLAMPALAKAPQADKPEDKGKVEPLPQPKEKPGKAEEEPGEEVGARGDRPPLELVILPGEAAATPYRKAVAYANGGIIDVAQPNPTTLVVTMSGLSATNADLVCTSAAGYKFDLTQCFEVRFNSRRVKHAHLTMEGKVQGLLRTNHELYTPCLFAHKGGTAETGPATAHISVGNADVLGLEMPSRSASCGDDLSVYNHEGPLAVPVTSGKYTLHQDWSFGTTHPPFCCRGASAEFSPQPQYCPEAATAYWFQHFHPFNGMATKDFGFQVVIKLVAD